MQLRRGNGRQGQSTENDMEKCEYDLFGMDRLWLSIINILV